MSQLRRSILKRETRAGNKNSWSLLKYYFHVYNTKVHYFKRMKAFTDIVQFVGQMFMVTTLLQGTHNDYKNI